jgi:beta-glucosidase
MPWRDSVPAILFELMPGQESGNSIASTILGANNPSGKTTITFPNSMNETWLGDNSSRYPGVDRGLGFLEVDYGEELLMGYRWYDAMGIEPLFPFGHGLSYSSFAYSNLAIKGILSSNPDSVCNVSFSIDLQPGSPPGTEVAQLYIEFPNGLGEPPRVLKGFAKVSLTPGVTAHVSIQLKGKDMFMWDENTDAWRSQAGLYYAVVGSSSRDLRLRGPFDIIG